MLEETKNKAQEKATAALDKAKEKAAEALGSENMDRIKRAKD